MSTQKTFPDSATTGAQTAEPSADAVLASAAQTAQPDAQPEVERQPAALVTDQVGDATIGNPPFDDQREQPVRSASVQPIYSIERARSLPEIGPDQMHDFDPLEHEDPAAILAFKEEDGRTMRVAVGPQNNLSKVHVGP